MDVIPSVMGRRGGFQAEKCRSDLMFRGSCRLMCEDSMLGPRVKARGPIREALAKVPGENTVACPGVVAVEKQEVTEFGIDARA